MSSCPRGRRSLRNATKSQGNLPVPSAFEPGTTQSRPSVERVNKLEKPLSVRRHVPRAAALCLLAERPLHVPCVSLKVLLSLVLRSVVRG